MGLVYWRGDFDTGDFSQYSGVQAAPNAELAAEFCNSPGEYCLHAGLRGDEPLVNGGKRCEVVQARADLVQREGYTMFLNFAHRIPRENDVDALKRWLVWMQFHHMGNTASPPVEFCQWGDVIGVRVNGVIVWQSTITAYLANYPNMHRWGVAIKWSNDPAVGWIQLCLDGKVILSKLVCRTLSDDGAYLKMGIYRHPDMTSHQWMYHDDVEMWVVTP